MEKEIFGNIAARTGGKCVFAVAGAEGCGKSSFLRGVSAAAGLTLAEDGKSACGSAEGAALTLFECASLEKSFSACAVILITSDGSFGKPRSECAAAEEDAVRALREAGRTFVVLLNSADPASDGCEALRASLEEKYGAGVVSANCAKDEQDHSRLFEEILLSLPLVRLELFLPEWMSVLPADNSMIAKILETVREVSPHIRSMRDCSLLERAFADGETYCEACEADAASGVARYRMAAREGLFYKVLSEECGAPVEGNLQLMAYVRALRESKRFYDKFRGALRAADELGYGIVQPGEEDMQLRAPELVRKGTRCGVKLCADACAYHIIKVDVHSEVSPVTGDSPRSEEIAKGIVENYERDPEALWNTDMFGKSFKDMVREGLNEKTVPEEARGKLRRAVTRIVNEGKGGVLCILL